MCIYRKAQASYSRKVVGKKKRPLSICTGTGIKEKSICGFLMLIFHKKINEAGCKFLSKKIVDEASKTSRYLRLYFCVLGEGSEKRKESMTESLLRGLHLPLV